MFWYHSLSVTPMMSSIRKPKKINANSSYRKQSSPIMLAFCRENNSAWQSRSTFLIVHRQSFQFKRLWAHTIQNTPKCMHYSRYSVVHSMRSFMKKTEKLHSSFTESCIQIVFKKTQMKKRQNKYFIVGCLFLLGLNSQ